MDQGIKATNKRVKKKEEKPKTVYELVDEMSTSERVENLERCVAEMAHFSGTQRVLDKYGIKRWVPGEKDLRKRRD